MNVPNSHPALYQAAMQHKQATFADRAHETGKDFESYFLYQSIDLMMPDSSDNPVMGGGTGERMFREILNENIADALADKGGVGLGTTIEKQLLKYQAASGLK